jgi:hypothetical protein
MYVLRKEWEDGGSLTVTYEGRSDGDATFTSGVNEGLDRETAVTFVDFSEQIRVECKVTQQGKREVFTCKDGEFLLGDGTFKVVKDGVQ